MKKLIAAILLLLGLGTVVSLFMPYQGFRNDTVIDIPRGTSSQQIAAVLEARGVIRSSWQFAVIRILQQQRTLQAGEYRFFGPTSPWAVFDRIAKGDVFYYELRVPEGFNMFEIAAAVDNLGVMKKADFLKAAADTTLVKDIAPEAPSLEGFLFPSVYRLTRATTAGELCRQMVSEFRTEWQALESTQPALPVVTLASLVEKETSVRQERPLVAGVYANRLQRGIKLDADPTTAYAAQLAGKWRGTIYRSDLDRQHPYNTYRVPGLPPGPIANPGRDSLRAAIAPEVSEYLFFVARPDRSGRHIFSKDVAAHERAVAEYRRGNQKAAGPSVARP